MVRTREELLESIRSVIGEDTSDVALSLIEDATDTLQDMETRISESGDWQRRYEENDADWRKRYRDRFFSDSDTKVTEVDDKAEGETEVITKYDDLFEEE